MNAIKAAIVKSPKLPLTAALSPVRKPAFAAVQPIRNLKLSATPKECAVFQDSAWDSREMLQAMAVPWSGILCREDIPRLACSGWKHASRGGSVESPGVDYYLKGYMRTMAFAVAGACGITSMMGYRLYEASKKNDTK